MAKGHDEIPRVAVRSSSNIWSNRLCDYTGSASGWIALIGTLLGGITAAALGIYFAPGLITFAAGMLVMGWLCALLPGQGSAYRVAAITLAIVILPKQTEPIFHHALHRFLEVSVGIVVGMATVAVWPDRAGDGSP